MLLFAVLAKRHEQEKKYEEVKNEGKRSVFQPPVSHTPYKSIHFQVETSKHP